MSELKIPPSLSAFMYMLMDNACRDSFVDLCENYGIDYNTDYEEIKKWFKDTLGIFL